MNRWIAIAIVGFGLLAHPVLGQDRQPTARRGEAARQARENWERALANSTLTPEEKAALRKDLETVRNAARARRLGETVDEENARAAAQRVREVMQSDKIRPEDREAIRDQWRDAAEKRGGRGGRKGSRRQGGERSQ
jgi:hypothetical protein